MANLTNLSDEVMMLSRMAICDMIRAFKVKSERENGAYLKEIWLTPMTCYSLYKLISSDEYYQRNYADILEFLKNGTNHPETL